MKTRLCALVGIPGEKNSPQHVAHMAKPALCLTALVGLPAFERYLVARKLAKSTLERFRKRLEEEKDRLEEQIEDYERDLEEARLTESSSDRSPDPGNAEASSMKLEYAKELSIEQNTLDLLNKVNRALDKIADGTYGLCEVCGNPIPVERLDVLPYSTLCVEDASRLS